MKPVTTQTPSFAAPVKRPRGRARSPRLRDGSRFVRIRGVPVVTLNVRKFRKGDEVVEERIDEEKLHRIARNSNERASRGEYGLLLAGHTTDDGPETAQPPVVGYTRKYQVGDYNGKPAILADFYLLKNKDPDRLLEQYPRRSPEIMGLNDPDAYLDATALIRRSPELDLGYISHFRIDRDVTRFEAPVARYKSGRQIYRFNCSRYCPSEHDEPSRFGPSGEEPSMPGMVNKNAKAVASLLDAVKNLVLGEAEEGAALGEEEGMLGDEFGGGPSGGEDMLGEPSGGEMMEGGGEEPSFEPSAPSGDMEMEDEPSGASGEEPSFGASEPSDEFEEPSRHRHASRHVHHHHYESSRRPSRHHRRPPVSSGPSASPSPSEPSRMRSHRRPSKHASVGTSGSTVPMPSDAAQMRRMGGRKSATRLDPQITPVGKKGYMSRNQAGYPGPYDSEAPRVSGHVSRHRGTGIDPVMTGGRGGGRRPKVDGAIPRTSMGKEGEVSRHSTTARPTRMRRDSERTKVSRYQRENEELRGRISRLEDQDRKSRYQAREALMERHVIQLESEGYVLDREEEVKDLMRCKDDKEVARYIKKVRSRYTRTAVGQPMIPASFFEDPNEVADREMSRYGHMSDQEALAFDTDRQDCTIIGSGFARYEAANRSKIEGEGWQRGRNVVSQYFDSRKPARGRRDEE
jgi:hypothetical protein